LLSDTSTFMSGGLGVLWGCFFLNEASPRVPVLRFSLFLFVFFLGCGAFLFLARRLLFYLWTNCLPTAIVIAFRCERSAVSLSLLAWFARGGFLRFGLIGTFFLSFFSPVFLFTAKTQFMLPGTPTREPRLSHINWPP